jgi:Domain of unknown function (DUF4337)
MPEGPEVEMENLHEAIKEELEHEGGRFLKLIALTTAILAVFAAVSALKAGATVNEALILKTEATTLQAQASDQWAFYQAKGVKAAVQEASRTSWLSIGKEPPPAYEEAKARYAEEQKEIKTKANELEKERDQKNEEAEHLVHLHHRFASAVALFQVSIALGAVAALTRNRLVWGGSIAVGMGGIVLFLMGLAF